MATNTLNATNHDPETVIKVLNLCHIQWSLMDKEVIDDLIEYGRADATHEVLLHHHTGHPSGQTDKQLIHRKKAEFTIARTLYRARFQFNTSVTKHAIMLWIENFLPMFDSEIFNDDELNRLRNMVRD